MDAPRPQRNRLHVDVWVPPEQAEARVAPAWWTLADPEDNEVDVATWTGRDRAGRGRVRGRPG